MQLEPTSVRWVNEEAREAYEKWLDLIEQEMERARARLDPPAPTEVIMAAVDPKRLYEETRARVQPMKDAAAKLYAAYTMPVHVVRKSEPT